MTRPGAGEVSAGEVVARVLGQAGVRRVFGVPGESFLGFLDALHDAPIEYVATRHEGGGAFMASGYGKVAGEIAVCTGTRAVGASNMAIGIHTARQDSTPMIAIAGQVNRPFRGREAFQELDLVGVFSHYAKWAVEIADAAQVHEIMVRTVRVATSGRPGPVFVSLPEDVLPEPVAVPPEIPLLPDSAPAPDPDAIAAALGGLLSAERPLVLAGGGVLASPGATDLLVRFAEATAIPVVTSWRRHDAFPNDHPLFLGSASLGQPPCAYERLAVADHVLALGTRFQEITTRGYTLPGPACAVTLVDVEPLPAGRPPAARAIVADAAATLRALLERVDGHEPRAAWVKHNAEDRRRYEAATTPAPAPRHDGTVDPASVIDALGALLPPEAVLTTDAGNFSTWLSRYYRFRRPGTFVGPTSGAMGYGVPAAIGAAFAAPGTPVVSCSGDGGFLMSGTELEVAVRYGLPVVCLVFDNGIYGTIRMHQERHYPGRVVGTTLSTPDLRRMADSFGAAGFTLTDDADVHDVLAAALRTPGPSVVHVRVSPERVTAATG
jgi:acetolactate synthase-1/2/3 large subunit